MDVEDACARKSRQFAVSASVERSAVSNEQLCVQLRATLRAVRNEAHERLSDHHVVGGVRHAQQLAERRSFQLRVVRAQVQLGQLQLVSAREEIIEPLAWWMQLQPITGVPGDE